MRDKQMKKAQKKINKSVRALNKNIREDTLWRGRFVIRQLQADWERFDDGSGGILMALLEIRDLKTGTYMNFTVDNYASGWRLFEEGNKFICEYSGVWDDISLVKNDKTDYSKIKWKPVKRVGGW